MIDQNRNNPEWNVFKTIVQLIIDLNIFWSFAHVWKWPKCFSNFLNSFTQRSKYFNLLYIVGTHQKKIFLQLFLPYYLTFLFSDPKCKYQVWVQSEPADPGPFLHRVSGIREDRNATGNLPGLSPSCTTQRSSTRSCDASRIDPEI